MKHLNFFIKGLNVFITITIIIFLIIGLIASLIYLGNIYPMPTLIIFLAVLIYWTGVLASRERR